VTWKRALWGLPVLVFLATFGVFAVRHPGSVDAFASSTKGIVSGAVMAGAGLIALVVGLRVKTLRAVTPLLLTAVVIASAIYAEVPFEQKSTQNRRLVAGDVVDAGATTATTTVTAASATRHSAGTLNGINHTASGDVSVIESATGDWVIRFQNFTVQGSPAPVLYIVEGEDERDPGGTKLGAFTATSGSTLDVALPAGVEPGPGWTVLIWCEKFATPIANATQRAT
jgi:hypothetical protein